LVENLTQELILLGKSGEQLGSFGDGLHDELLP